MHSSRQHSGRQAQNVPARLVQQHFPGNLGTDSQCVPCSKSHTCKCSKYGCKDFGNVHLCVASCFRICHIKYFNMGGFMLPCV